MDKTSLISLERDEFLSTDQVCAILCVTRPAFYKILKKSLDFPRGFKLTNNMQARVRYKKSEVLAWLNSRRVTA